MKYSIRLTIAYIENDGYSIELNIFLFCFLAIHTWQLAMANTTSIVRPQVHSFKYEVK